MKHAVTWFEVMGTELGSLKKFYAELFDWDYEGIEGADNYVMVKSDGKSKNGEPAIPGGLGEVPAEVPRGYTTFYVEVEDLNKTLEQVKALGGKVLFGEMPISCGKIALFEDPQGNPIGLAQMNAG